jgi:VanZ family protein
VRSRHRSSATVLAVVYALLVVYASLYPFAGWRWPAGRDLLELVALPWLARSTRFDEWSNFAGYLPLGALAFAAAVRTGRSAPAAWLGAGAGCAALSYGLEVLQHLVPGRVPSRLDFVLNTAGAMVGLIVSAWLWKLGAFERWQAGRDRWLVPGSAGGLVLLLLWPVALLFPSPIPLAPGQVLEAVADVVTAFLTGTPLEREVLFAFEDELRRRQPLAPLSEGLTIALGMLAPCLLAHSVVRPGWRRVAAVALAVIAGGVALALSTALNFGPAHGMAWLSVRVAVAMGFGAGLAIALCGVSPRVAALLALLALTVLVVLVAQVPPDPYYAESLQRWEQGRFIRFHGIAQWVGWLWPYAAMGWLFMRLAAPLGRG